MKAKIQLMNFYAQKLKPHLKFKENDEHILEL